MLSLTVQRVQAPAALRQGRCPHLPLCSPSLSNGLCLSAGGCPSHSRPGLGVGQQSPLSSLSLAPHIMQMRLGDRASPEVCRWRKGRTQKATRCVLSQEPQAWALSPVSPACARRQGSAGPQLRGFFKAIFLCRVQAVPKLPRPHSTHLRSAGQSACQGRPFLKASLTSTQDCGCSLSSPLPAPLTAPAPRQAAALQRRRCSVPSLETCVTENGAPWAEALYVPVPWVPWLKCFHTNVIFLKS